MFCPWDNRACAIWWGGIAVSVALFANVIHILVLERPVSIGSGSWLGHGVVVLPGSRIGKNVAVGANSVVTGDLPDFCVAVGAPARVIRRYSQDSGWSAKSHF